MSENTETIVLDIGSGSIKAGIAGELAPRSIFPSIIGRPKYNQLISGLAKKEYYIGNEAISNKGILTLTYPINHGIISSFNDIEKLFHHTFWNELRYDVEECPTLLTETPLNPKKNREKMTSIMFESFNCPSIYIANQSILSLYAYGNITGIVLNSGDGVTHTTPVYDGYALQHAIERMNIGGSDITQHLHKLLHCKGLCFMKSSEMEIVKDIKEKLGRIALTKHDYKTKQISYELPDGEIIKIGKERYECGEILFNPSILGSESPGIDKLLHTSIESCDIDVKRDLYKNIVLSGGTTMFKGFTKRLNTEINKLAPISIKTNIISKENRKYNTWIGGSILADLTDFKDNWLTQDMYDEYGSTIVHRLMF